MERALREEQQKLKQVYQDVEKTEAERKFEEIKRQRVSFYYYFSILINELLIFIF